MLESKKTIPASLIRVTAAEVFRDAKRLEEVLSEIEHAARAIVPDMSSAKGRTAIASVAAKVARSKTYLDGLGKDMVRGLKQQAGEVDARRRMLRGRLDALKAEVRQPLTDFEQAEADRLAAIRARMAEIRRAQEDALLLDAEEASSGAVAAVVARVEAIDVDESFQELQAEAQQLKDAALYRLVALRSRVQAREEAQAKAEAARKTREEQERRDREERIARDAADRATRAAEEHARKVAEKAKHQRLAAEQATRKAEQARLDAERRAEEAEQRRQQEAVAAAARAKRAADRAHRARVHRDAAAELVMHADITAAQAHVVVGAIARGLITQISIDY